MVGAGYGGRFEIGPVSARIRELEPERVLELVPQDARRVGLVGAAVTDHPRIVELVRAIHRRGVAILLIEHVMQAIVGLADRVVVLHHGQKIREGATADVLSDDVVIRAYLGARVAES
jgi:ABC-type lipopolysaccharide export system ATPase subunit